MRILLQGTGAADGIPALYSDSRLSRLARELGGKEIRSRCAALIDGHLKIDLGPDTWHQVVRDRLDPSEWTAVLFTHSHEDHFTISELQYWLYPFAHTDFSDLMVYGNAAILSAMQQRYPEWPIPAQLIAPKEPFDHLDYRITPIPAYHKLEEASMNFIIERQGKSMLYASDTGYYREETWDFLPPFRLDALVVECTEGKNRTDYYGHMDLKECIAFVTRLREMQVLNPDAIVATTHHSDLGDLSHSDLEDLLAPHGILPGFDGMILEIK